jgi:hypothetical protein
LTEAKLQNQLEQKLSSLSYTSPSSDARNNVSYSTFRQDVGGELYPNFASLYQAWLMATSQTAAESTGDVSAFKYSSFDNSYPQWQKSSLLAHDPKPFSGQYFQHSSYDIPDLSGNPDFIHIIAINGSGEVTFYDSGDPGTFNGEKIVANVNPHYDYNVRGSVVNQNAQGETITLDGIAASMRPGQKVSLSGYLTHIGNEPFVETVLVTTDKEYFSLKGPLPELNKRTSRIELKGKLTGQKSRRKLPVLEITSLKPRP